MSHFTSATFARHVSAFVPLLALMLVALPAEAQFDDEDVADVVGRVNFEFADAPAPTIAVDFNQGMLSAIAGVGKAAIQGVTEALVESVRGPAGEAVQESAEHLQALDEIFQLVSHVILEVRVRVYENLATPSVDARDSIIEHYQNKLRRTDWDNVVRVREEGNTVVVCALQRDATIHGLFVIVRDQDDLVMVNVVCELSPDKVKQLTSQATKIGMKVGLGELIEDAMQEIHKRRR